MSADPEDEPTGEELDDELGENEEPGEESEEEPESDDGLDGDPADEELDGEETTAAEFFEESADGSDRTGDTADAQSDAEGASERGVDQVRAGTTDSPEGDVLLETEGLDAGYGDLQILDGVDMFVEDGEYVTIVGPNGAGKSTVMKSVFGLTNHMGGSVYFDGEEITGLDPEEIIHLGLSYVPQNENVFDTLTVQENLEMGAYILDEVPQDQLREIYDRFPILEERKTQKAGTLSGGQQQMLAMGRALMLDPDLLLLDEPSAGLAPDLVDDMFDRIDAINDAGTAVLMVEQNAKEALRRCDRGYVLVQGQNRFVDRGDVLLNDQEVRQEFLGG